MERAFTGNVLSQVRKRMKLFDVPGYRQSRRVEGLFNRDDEIFGFKNLCVYIHTALAEHQDTIAELLAHIDTFIYSQEHYNHTRWLMFFGSDHEKLAAPGASRVHQAIRLSSWRGSIAKAIADHPASNSIIPRLHNPGSINTHFPGRYDLALFFCKGKQIYTSEQQQKNFAAIRSRAMWFFFNDSELPDVEAGGFIPQHQILSKIFQ